MENIDVYMDVKIFYMEIWVLECGNIFRDLILIRDDI